MTKKRETDLSEQEERQISAFFDNELASFEHRSIESRIAAQEAAVLAEVERFQFAKSELKAFFKNEIEPAGAKLDIWSKIESELKRPERKIVELSWTERMAAAVRQVLQPRYAAATGALAAVLFVSFQLRSNDQTRPLQVASSPVSEVALEDGSAPGQPLILAAARSQDILSKIGLEEHTNLPPRLPVPDALAVRLLSAPQVFVDRRIPGGLRAGDTDIEWIKTQTPFRIVSTKRPDASPVIWVARSQK